MKDLFHNLKVTNDSFLCTSATARQSSVIDMKGFESVMFAYEITGTTAGNLTTGKTVTPAVIASASSALGSAVTIASSSETTYTVGSAIAAFTTATVNTMASVGLKNISPDYRYLGLTLTGNSTDTLIYNIATIQGAGRDKPVTT